MQRIILVLGLVGMILLVVLGVIFVPAILSAQLAPPQNHYVQRVVPTPDPTVIPSPTPTPEPTATPLPTPSPTPAPFITGTSAFAMDADTGRVLYDENSAEQVPIASLTKIMTAIVAIEQGKLEDGVTVTQQELDEVPAGASSAGLKVDDYFRLRTLLYGLLLRSGADASIAIAHTVAGSTDAFVGLMNSKAQELQLTNTHYGNPHGLNDENNYSTAADLTKLGNYVMKNTLFAQIVGTPAYDISATQYTHKYHWDNVNGFIASYQGADGVKTGNTDAAGVCLVFSARRNGHHIVGAEMHTNTYAAVYADGAKLLDLAFSKE